MSNFSGFIKIAFDLEDAGLVWMPVIGDEVSKKTSPQEISILVDPQGLTPIELRSTYLWLPTVEQMIEQLESRQAILFHAGLELSTKRICYKTVVQIPGKHIEAVGDNLRTAMALSLRDLLLTEHEQIH